MEVNVLQCVLTVLCALIMSTNFNLAFCFKLQHDKVSLETMTFSMFVVFFSFSRTVLCIFL